MKLVLIPPGEFMMGSPKELIEEELKTPGIEGWYKDHLPSEGPQHRVRITKPFYLGIYLVTQEEYQRVMGTNPSAFSATGKGKDRGGRSGHEAVSGGECFVGRCGGVLPKTIGSAGRRRQRGERIACLRRPSGSMRVVRGARAGSVSVWAAAGFPRSPRSTKLSGLRLDQRQFWRDATRGRREASQPVGIV